MKKLFAILLCLAMMLSVMLTFTACDAAQGNSGGSQATEDSDSDSTTDTTENTTPPSTTDTTPPTTEASVPSTDAAPSVPATEPKDPDNGNAVELAEPGQVIFDSQGLKVTALQFAEDSELSVNIDIFIENQTGQDIYLDFSYATINGYMITGTVDSFKTVAGESENARLSFRKSDLEFEGIDVIREICIAFYAEDASFDVFIAPSAPVSIKTTAYNAAVSETDAEGVEVYHDNGILVVAKEYLTLDSRYTRVKLLVENTGDVMISLSCKKLVVNGKEIGNPNSIRYGRVPAGSKIFTSMDIETSALTDLGIDQVHTVEMTLQILNAEDWTTIVQDLKVALDFDK